MTIKCDLLDLAVIAEAQSSSDDFSAEFHGDSSTLPTLSLIG